MARSDVQVSENSNVVNSGYEVVPVGDLVEHPANPRRGDTPAIAQSIDANGFYGAVVVQKSSNRIIAGNHRFQAAQQQGMDAVPVIWADVDDETAMRILLADNRTNDKATYDGEALLELLQEAQANDNLVGTGYTGDDIEKMLAAIGEQPLPEGDADDEGFLTVWGVIVECDNEDQQSRLLEQLDDEGFRVRALVGG